MIGYRIKEVRNYGGFNLDVFSEKLGISKRTLQNYEKNSSEPTVSLVITMANLCHVSEWWLLTGKESMLSNKDNYSSNENDLVELPYFADTYASAGGGAINYKETKKPIAFDKSFLEKMLGITVSKNLHIINAIGNSMDPTIKEGELLFVNPFENESCQIKDGGIYVINCNNSTFVKRINHNPITGATLLKSDNTTYPDMEITGQEFESCIIIGRVVGHFANF